MHYNVMQTRAFQNNMAFKEQALSMSDNVGVPTGEMGVSSEINIVFSLEYENRTQTGGSYSLPKNKKN